MVNQDNKVLINLGNATLCVAQFKEDIIFLNLHFLSPLRAVFCLLSKNSTTFLIKTTTDPVKVSTHLMEFRQCKASLTATASMCSDSDLVCATFLEVSFKFRCAELMEDGRWSPETNTPSQDNRQRDIRAYLSLGLRWRFSKKKIKKKSRQQEDGGLKKATFTSDTLSSCLCVIFKGYLLFLCLSHTVYSLQFQTVAEMKNKTACFPSFVLLFHLLILV